MSSFTPWLSLAGGALIGGSASLLLMGKGRIAGISGKTRFRHYVNIGRMEGRLNQLLRDFKWGRMDQVFLYKLTQHASVS